MRYSPSLKAVAGQAFSGARTVTLANWAGGEALDALCVLARSLCDVPMAVIVLANEDILWIKGVSTENLDVAQQLARLCDLARLSGEVAVLDQADGGSGLRFMAAMPIYGPDDRAIGALAIADGRAHPFDPAQEAQLAALAQMADHILRCDGMRPQAAPYGPMIAAATSAAHYKKMYDRLSSLALMGVWECDLRTNALIWTDGVYDLFELPRGTPLRREQTVGFYHPESRVDMERLRAQAIATCGSFSMDAQIRTALGKDRWMRLTADVECEQGIPVRIFGSKQDVTLEKGMWLRMQQLAECDALTGLANRGVFQERFQTADNALALVDIDGFKQINDALGHAAGDACLRGVADRLREAADGAELIARIGGDEFALLLRGPHDQVRLGALMKRILTALRQPLLWNGQSVPLSASIGLAMPGNEDAETLFARADAALYAAKAAGRNRIRVAPPGRS